MTSYSHRIVRGTVSTATIPSKYQTVLLENAENEGFLSRSKRFSDDMYTNDKPGPGTYNYTGRYEDGRVTSSVSISKKGTGAFPSKDRRFSRIPVIRSPGPATYVVPRRIRTQQDFNQTSCTAIFHLPIAQPHTRDTGPGPSEYYVKTVRDKCGYNSAGPAFKSTVQRNTLNFNRDATSKVL